MKLAAAAFFGALVLPLCGAQAQAPVQPMIGSSPGFTPTNPGTVTSAPSASFGLTPIVSSAAEASHVLKSLPDGVLYSLYVTTGATAGYLMTFNATSVPADGAVTPVECVIAPANSTVAVTFGSGPPDSYPVGITAVFSSTGCFTKTASATAFFKGRVK